MGDIMRVMLHINPAPTNENDANQIVDNALATVVHSYRSAVNHFDRKYFTVRTKLIQVIPIISESDFLSSMPCTTRSDELGVGISYYAEITVKP